MPLWLRILLRFLLTVLLVWAMTVYLPEYFVITGGLKAFVIIGALITLMNMIVTPILELLVLPLRLLASLLAIIIVNGAFVWLTVWIVGAMEPTLVTLEIQGGIAGWIVVAIALGLGKWLMRISLK